MALSPGDALHSQAYRTGRDEGLALAATWVDLGNQLRTIKTAPVKLGAFVLDHVDAPAVQSGLVGYATKPDEIYQRSQTLSGIWVGAALRHEGAKEVQGLERHLARLALTVPTFIGFNSIGDLQGALDSARRIAEARSNCYEPGRAAVLPVYEGYPGITPDTWAVGVKRSVEATGGVTLFSTQHIDGQMRLINHQQWLLEHDVA